MDDRVEKQREHFESLSDTYYRARQDERHLFFKYSMWEYFFTKAAPHFCQQKFNCLEPMCGYGDGYEILSRYLQADFTYQGFDYSAVLVEIANQIKPDLVINQGNVLDYTAPRQYDLIILIGGLHHVYYDAQKALHNLSNLLVPGGLFINLEPTHNNYFFKKVRDYVYRKNSLFDQEAEQGFGLAELNCLFENSGFQLLEQIYPGLLAYILYFNPDAFQGLALGNTSSVKRIFNLEKPLYSSFIGKYFSFATISLWKKS